MLRAYERSVLTRSGLWVVFEQRHQKLGDELLLEMHVYSRARIKKELSLFVECAEPNQVVLEKSTVA